MSTESELSPVAAVVVLAAGGGTRMKSTKSKLLHEVAGKSMLSFAVSSATALDPEHLVVVVGHLREQVEEHLEKLSASVTTAVQDEQLGTGHAVGCGLAALPTGASREQIRDATRLGTPFKVYEAASKFQQDVAVRCSQWADRRPQGPRAGTV